MINNRYFPNSFFADHLIQRKGSWLWGIVSDIKTVLSDRRAAPTFLNKI